MDAHDLEGVPLFDGLSKRDLEKVARWADVVDIDAGYHLLYQGRLPHEFFVIIEGDAEVERTGKPLAVLRAGDFFGEIALLEDDRRTATVIAATPMRLMVMASREFDSMCHDFPTVAVRLEEAEHARSPRFHPEQD